MVVLLVDLNRENVNGAETGVVSKRQSHRSIKLYTVVPIFSI